MAAPVMGRTGFGGFLRLCFLFPSLSPMVFAANILLGDGSQSNHLLVLFSPGNSLFIEVRHNGSIQTGQQLLAAGIEASGGMAITTPALHPDGKPVSFSSQISGWNGQGLFAHFYDYGWGIFVNGFAWGSLSAFADGSWSSYFTYQIGGASAGFTLAPVGARDRALADGDHDAYVLTSTHPSPGLAAWKIAHGITDLQADPDGDGMNNLFEYALRRHPQRPDARDAVVMGRSETNGDIFLTLTYRRPHDSWAEAPPGADAGYDGVGYTVETSTNLVNWESGTNYLTQTISPDDAGPMATVVARVPANSAQRFLRLRIHLP